MTRLVPTALVVLALASCSPPSVEPGSTAPPDGAAVTVRSVADGDTFDSTDGVTFRLDGINAPETGECFYEEAAESLRGLIVDAEVEVAATGTDQFGRTLAHVYADGEWVNLRLVTDGMALATTPEDDESAALVEAEDEAFEARAGLWAADACGAVGPVPAVTFDPGMGDADPPGPDEDALAAETVVIVNRGQVEVDLSGWSIRDESSRHRFAFADGTVVSTGGRITIASSDPGWDPGSSPVWNNGGDLALLVDPFGRIVDRYRY